MQKTKNRQIQHTITTINKKKENKNNEKRELGGGGENREVDCLIA